MHDAVGFDQWRLFAFSLESNSSPLHSNAHIQTYLLVPNEKLVPDGLWIFKQAVMQISNTWRMNKIRNVAQSNAMFFTISSNRSGLVLLGNVCPFSFRGWLRSLIHIYYVDKIFTILLYIVWNLFETFVRSYQGTNAQKTAFRTTHREMRYQFYTTLKRISACVCYHKKT